MDRLLISQDHPSSPDALDEIIERVIAKGARLWIESGNLRYKAPKGALTTADIDRLRAAKMEIVARLTRESGRMIQVAQAPATFSQLHHYNLYRLNERMAVRQVAGAMSMRGRIHLEAMRESIIETIRRQEALRTTIGRYENHITQKINPPVGYEWDIHDLAAAKEDHRLYEVHRSIAELILHPVSVFEGPLFGARLIRLSEREHILVLAMEHIVSDMVSLNIVFRDLLTGYEQMLNGVPIGSHPPLQFSDYAIWQNANHAKWVSMHGSYWEDHLRGCGRVRFPDDAAHCVSLSASGWGVLTVRVDRSLAVSLRNSCRVYKTTLVLWIFTVYAALVLRWCEVGDGVIQFQTDGRGGPETRNTVGYFAAPLSLRLQLHPRDSLVSLLHRVAWEYGEACVHADSSYLESRVPKPEFCRNTAFNWLPSGSASEGLALKNGDDALLCSVLPFDTPVLKQLTRDSEPAVQLSEIDGGINVDVLYPRERFKEETMERFARNFFTLLKSSAADPDRGVVDIDLA
jgi:hypothetical protein